MGHPDQAGGFGESRRRNRDAVVNGGEGHIEQRRSDENHGESDSLGKSKPAIRALGDEPRAINQGATAEDQCCCDPERDAEGGDIAIDFLSTQPLS